MLHTATLLADGVFLFHPAHHSGTAENITSATDSRNLRIKGRLIVSAATAVARLVAFNRLLGCTTMATALTVVRLRRR